MMKNSTKVWIFTLTTALLLLILGHSIAGRTGLFFGFLAALGLNVLVFLYGENHLLKLMRAERLLGQDPWGLLDLVKEMSQKLGIEEPSLYITPHASTSAFCVGHSWKASSMCFTTGLVQNLSPQELSAVVAHQLCHIRRLDTFGFGVSSTLANSIVGLGQVLDSLLPRVSPRFAGGRIKFNPFSSLLSPIGWLIIKIVVRQKSFFENDLMASQLIDDRHRLGKVLWRLEGLAQTKPLAVPACTSHLFIVNPEGFERKNFFLKSHPTIERRLKKLMGYYPV